MYFPFFVLRAWGKRSAEARSPHCAVLPEENVMGETCRERTLWNAELSRIPNLPDASLGRAKRFPASAFFAVLERDRTKKGGCLS